MAGLSDRFAARRVFVTGHTGFKGAWLALWLEMLGARVTGFALPPVDVRGNLFKEAGLAARMTHIEGDIRDADAVARALEASKADIVFHLAAQPIVIDSYADPAGTFSTNAMGTAHVLEACRKIPGIRTVIAVTSDKCYENDESGRLFREGDPLGGHDPYSASKAASEIVVHAYRRSFLEPAGIKCASVRAGNVIGGGDFAPHRIIPDIAEAVAADKPVILRNPQAVRPWQHVLDALHGYLMLADALERGAHVKSAYNFGPAESEDNVTVEAMAQAFIKAIGRGSYKAAPAGDRRHEARTLRLDPGAAMKDLGWRPKFSALEAVSITAAWYRDYLSGADALAITQRDIAQFQA